MSETAVAAQGVWKSYPSGSRRLEVLRGLSLTVTRGELVAIVGESGAGKSTLLHLLGGLDRLDAGRIEVAGEALDGLSPAGLARFRARQVGFVFQFHHLLPEFTAEENALLPCLIRREPVETARRRARTLLAELGVLERATHRPAELSGGEQQRVAVARALASDPAVLLADEPTGNLDPPTGQAVFDLLRRVTSRRGTTTILVTHSERLARSCDRILRMEDGVLEVVAGRGATPGLETPALPV
jgi:lipoprotein-releasing system ATP-binding protein